MLDIIEADLRRLDGCDRPRPVPNVRGRGAHTAGIPVSTLASASVCAAVSALQSLSEAEFGQVPEATVDEWAVDQWCQNSVTPIGWSLPPKWDPFARDYRTGDGWIRLHTNAPHHRHAALGVLGSPPTPQDAAREILRWDSETLEEAIVDAGGCAAQLRTAEDWREHPQGAAVGSEPIIGWDEASRQSCRWAPTSRKRPLSGLRVLDLTRVLAGPVATRFLASVGADVLRIDPPHWNEDGNAIEMTVGKTCAGLDLREDKDRVVFRALLSSADVLVHGLRPDALNRLGFGIDACRAINPGLITVGLNAYGWSGPWAGRRGFDSLVQRSAGLAADKRGGVTALPYQVLDHATGYTMAAAALHALRLQRQSGRILSARLSLARQAKLLVDHTGPSESDKTSSDTAPPYQDDGRIEHTDWGTVRRMALPYRIEAVETGWNVAAHRLRSDAPRWRHKEEALT